MKTATFIDTEQGVAKSPSETIYPLSFGQEALWFQSLLNPLSPASNISGSFELEGELDVAVLEKAITQVMARHDTLRTTICMMDGQVIQKVSPEPRFNLPLIDLSGADAATQTQVLAHHSRTALETVFSLERGPLVKFSLTRLSEKRHVIHVTIHHIVADAWSIAIFKREVLLHYKAYKNGSSLTLPPIPIQYGQYARWQRDCFNDKESEQHLTYWKKTLSGIPAVLNLKSDFPRRRTISEAGATARCVIDPALTRALKAFCKSRRITLFAALLSGFASLIHQLSGEEDIVIGTAVTHRHRKEFQDLIGYLINLLPLRLRLDNFKSGEQLAAHVSTVVLGALAHQEVPFEAIVQQQQYVRVSGTHPLFQTAFVLNPPAKASYGISDLKAADRSLSTNATRFDLALNITELPDESIVGDLWYRTELFTHETGQDMVAQLIRIWSNLATRPDLPLPALSQSLDDCVLAQENMNFENAGAELNSCLHLEFEAQARKTPKKIAIIAQQSSLSYGALNASANKLAQVLRQRGVGREDIVGIGLRRGLDYVVSILAILKAGAVCLPLDITVPNARNQEIIEKSSACYIIAEQDFPTDVSASLIILGSQSLEEEFQAASPGDYSELSQEVRDGNRLAYLLFTSGSTGHPKGAALTHNAFVGALRDQKYIPFSDDTVILQHSPVTFDASAWELWAAFFSGGTCVISPEKLLTPATLKEVVGRHKLTTVFLVPSMFNAFVDEDCESLCGLREIMLGGEVPSITHLRRLRQLRPQLTIVNGYGPTETGIYAFAHVLPEGLPVERTIPIGRTLAHTSAYILNRSLDPCPKGVIGEIYLGGPRLARNYIADPQLTAERFLPDPFAGRGARMYKTGDFAFARRDGLVEFVGRQDRQIKLNGVRIETSEIEAILLEHEFVRNAMVLLHSPAPGIKRLVAFVLSDSSEENLGEILLGQLRSRLPQYMLPYQIFVSKSWPTNANSKVDCGALLASIPTRESAQAELDRCVTPTEQLLHEIWCQVLKLDAIGREDNFFVLGGSSILAIQVINRCVSANLPLTLNDLFELQTIAALAQACDRSNLDQAQIDFCTLQPASIAERPQRFKLPLITLQPKGVKRPLFLAHPSPGTSFCYLALANSLQKEQPVYGFQAEAFISPDRAPKTIEDMAISYIAAMKQAQPAGPYLLGGHSLGAIIAFEMAQQLTERKEQVECLLLLDSVAPVFEWKEGSKNLEEEERSVFIGTIKTLERFTGQSFGLHESFLRSLPLSEGYSLLYDKLREIKFVSKASDLSYIEKLINVSRAGHDAYKKYKARPWKGSRAILFRAAQTLASDYPGPISSALNQPYYRWDELLARPPETITIPGNHITMLTAPNVAELGCAITSRLS